VKLFSAIRALITATPTLKKRLAKALSCPVDLSYSQSDHRRIFIEPGKKNGIRVQLDPLFEKLDDDTFEALLSFIQKGHEEDKQALIEFLQRARQENPLPKEQHPLQPGLDDLLSQHFPQLPPITLVWGRRGKKGQQKSIRLASFWPAKMEVRIHPYVCDDRVPIFYQHYLIYHELCHAWLMVSGQAKAGEHHGPDFYRWEDQFSKVTEARLWEQNELPLYLAQVQAEEMRD
jgi:predicted SprT family Zn-dependent metalloprotease